MHADSKSLFQLQQCGNSIAGGSGSAGTARIRANGNDEIVAASDRGRMKVSLGRGVGYVYQESLLVGGRCDFMVNGAHIGCGEDEPGVGQITILVVPWRPLDLAAFGPSC